MRGRWTGSGPLMSPGASSATPTVVNSVRPVRAVHSTPLHSINTTKKPPEYVCNATGEWRAGFFLLVFCVGNSNIYDFWRSEIITLAKLGF